MTKEDLAALIDKSAYPFRLSKELQLQAKIAGLVVVYGASDDLMELRGSVEAEYDAYEGTEILVTRQGVFDETACHDKCAYFRLAKKQAQEIGQPIRAVWDKDGYSWMYETLIPHVTFEILEDDEPYCKGIIFALTEV